MRKEEKIAVIGLGYVGLPLALALATKYKDVVGFDISEEKISQLKGGIDPNCEGLESQIKNTGMRVTSDASALKGSTFFIVGVPTPIDGDNRPDLRPVEGACRTVGKALSTDCVVVFESTVYPGVTEEICGPLLEAVSGLKRGADFFLGYSPERMNPGDKEHTVETIVKVVSGESSEVLDRVAAVYSSVVKAGVFRATSIKVAEAAKVIENTQRDLNIALMNELSLIFDRMNISTKDVLEAAGTKWNFLKFSPGLVGGHCIGVDPYYLTTKAEQLGYHPEVILAGRRINDTMGNYVGQKTVKLLVKAGIQVKGAKVGVLGLTFKENVTDVRNSRVPNIISELSEFGVTALIHDPFVDPERAHEEYGLTLYELDKLVGLDALIVAVAHTPYVKMAVEDLLKRVRKGGVVIDVKSILDRKAVSKDHVYWSL